MEKKEFRETRETLNLTQYKLSQVIGLTPHAIQSYEQGIAKIPGSVARIVRLMRDNAIFRAIIKKGVLRFKNDALNIEGITREFMKVDRLTKDIEVLQEKMKETVEHLEHHLEYQLKSKRIELGTT